MDVVQLPFNLRTANAIAIAVRYAAQRHGVGSQTQTRAVKLALSSWTHGSSAAWAVATGTHYLLKEK